MADNKFIFGFEIDGDEEVIRKARAMGGAVKESFKPDSFNDVLNILKEYGPTLGIIGAAALALKASFDTVFEAEKIQKINMQFEILAENSQLAANALRDSVVGAANGLADDTEIIKASNEALVQLGNNAGRLGEVMQLARKITSVFGGDLLENFKNINTAVATGRTRMLQHWLGVIDADKAQNDFARSLGKTADVLSESGKQQAILNEVLRIGKEKTENLTGVTDSATGSWKQLKVSIMDAMDTLTLSFDKAHGDNIRSFMGGLKLYVDDVKTSIQATFGEGTEQARAKIKQLNDTITEHIEEIKEKEDSIKEGSLWTKMFSGTYEKRIEILKNELKDFKTQRDTYLKQIEDEENKSKPTGESDSSDKTKKIPGTFDTEKERQKRINFNKEILAIDKQRIEEQLKYEDDAEKAQELNNQLIANSVAETNNKILAIQNDKLKTEEEKAQEILLLNQTLEAKIQAMAENTAKVREQAAERGLNHSKGFIDGVTKAWKLGEESQYSEEKKLADRVKAVRESMANNAMTEMDKMVKGQEDAATAMKNIALLTIADQAEAEGKLMFGRSVWPPQPPGMAGGLALMALASYIRGQAGGGGGGGASPSVGSSSAASTTDTTAPADTSSAAPTPTPQSQKSVTLQIMGSYYETEQTKTKLMEMIREATDATDFKYVQIGQR